MEQKSKSNIQKFTLFDKDNVLLIVYNMIIYIYDGKNWGFLYISDINLPESGFEFIKKPCMVEIFQGAGADYAKVFLVSGGLNFREKTVTKSVYVLNFKQIGSQEIQCLLDFKYPDMATARYLHCNANIDNKFVVVVGGKNENGMLNSCEYLNLSTGEWNEFPAMATERSNFDCILTTSGSRCTLFAYGGYSKNGVLAENMIEVCDVNISNISSSKWYSYKMKYSGKNNQDIPRACSRLINNDDNLMIIGGTNGKHLLKGVFELDLTDFDVKKSKEIEINSLGEVITPRSNFHYFFREGDFYLVGGSCNKFVFSNMENSIIISNYSEKFTFDLNNNVESTDLPANRDIFYQSLYSLGVDQTELDNEPGFPYSCSIITKSFI